MAKKTIHIMNTAFRDGFQSVYGARVLTDDFLPALEAARHAGIDYFEAGGGARGNELPPRRVRREVQEESRVVRPSRDDDWGRRTVGRRAAVWRVRGGVEGDAAAPHRPPPRPRPTAPAPSAAAAAASSRVPRRSASSTVERLRVVEPRVQVRRRVAVVAIAVVTVAVAVADAVAVAVASPPTSLLPPRRDAPSPSPPAVAVAAVFPSSPAPPIPL